MKDYRIFRLDDAGHIAAAVEFYCETDEEALDIAAQQENSAGLELWHRAERIQLFPPPEQRAS